MAGRRTAWEVKLDRRRAIAKADKEGLLADSNAVLESLANRVFSKEITKDEALKELRRIRHNAKKNGLMTRAQVRRMS